MSLHHSPKQLTDAIRDRAPVSETHARGLPRFEGISEYTESVISRGDIHAGDVLIYETLTCVRAYRVTEINDASVKLCFVTGTLQVYTAPLPALYMVRRLDGLGLVERAPCDHSIYKWSPGDMSGVVLQFSLAEIKESGRYRRLTKDAILDAFNSTLGTPM